MGTWHDYIRGQRVHMIQENELLEAGTIGISRTEAGVITDLGPEAIETNKRNIAEIEELLTAADQPIE
jgi:hypothetical protein